MVDKDEKPHLPAGNPHTTHRAVTEPDGKKKASKEKCRKAPKEDE